MLRFGSLELGTTPRVAVALTDAEVRDHAGHVKDLIDVFELRIDRFSRHEPAYIADVAASARTHGVPLLATVRAANEGGEADLGDDDRLRILTAVAPWVEAIDIELHAPIRDTVVQLCRHHQLPVILSFHDFTHTPADAKLVEIIRVGKTAGGDIVKLSTIANTRADTDRLLGILRQERAQHLIIIAMGAEGTLSRVFFPLFGSMLTWSYLHTTGAPGQLPLHELIDQLCRYAPDFARRHGRGK